MEMELTPHKSALRLRDCEREKDALLKQLEELKTELQKQTIGADSLQKEVQITTNETDGRQQEGDRVVREQRARQQLRDEALKKTREELKKTREELKKTREELACQKNVKEVFIRKEKEARCELERLWRLSDQQTQNAQRIATAVGSDIRKKKKKVLQKEFQELKVAHIVIQEKFSAERGALIKQLEDSKETILENENQSSVQNKMFQEAWKQLEDSQGVINGYQTLLDRTGQHVDELKKDLMREIQDHSNTLREIQDYMRQRVLIAHQHAADEVSLSLQTEESEHRGGEQRDVCLSGCGDSAGGGDEETLQSMTVDESGSSSDSTSSMIDK